VVARAAPPKACCFIAFKEQGRFTHQQFIGSKATLFFEDGQRPQNNISLPGYKQVVALPSMRLTAFLVKAGP
jgi:hypothetical protein